jgi:peptide/nickel transport system permease protein
MLAAAVMLVFIGKRLLGGVLLLFVVTAIVFVMFFMLADSRTHGGAFTGWQGQFDTRGSVVEQYVRFVGNIVLHGELPESPQQPQPVTAVIARALPVTASLVIGGTILFLLISFPIALLSALKPRSLLDRGLMLFVLVGFCAHPVWLSLVFSFVFGLKLHWFPLNGHRRGLRRGGLHRGHLPAPGDGAAARSLPPECRPPNDPWDRARGDQRSRARQPDR